MGARRFGLVPRLSLDSQGNGVRSFRDEEMHVFFTGSSSGVHPVATGGSFLHDKSAEE
jgi:hypothetical protein